MGRHYRSYSYQFKKDLVDQIESGQISITDAAREHNLMRSLIRRWIDQFHKGSIVEKPTVREKALVRELEHYKKKVGELTVANDLLKKTMESSRRRRKLNSSVVTQKTLDRSKEPVK
jgi:transposase-like protein